MNKKFTPILVLIAVGIIGLVVLITVAKPSIPQKQDQTIESTSDLDAAEIELDAQDIDGLGNEFNQTDADASTF